MFDVHEELIVRIPSADMIIVTHPNVGNYNKTNVCHLVAFPTRATESEADVALTQTQRRSLAGMAGMAFLATVGLFAAIDNHASGVGKALIVAIAVTGLVFHSTVRHQLMIGKALSTKRLRLLSAFFLVGAVLIVAVSLSGGADGLLYFGLVCLYVGIGLIVAELRRSGKVGKWVGAGFFVVSVALLVVGANTLPNSPGTGGTLPRHGRVGAVHCHEPVQRLGENRVLANASLRFAGVLAVARDCAVCRGAGPRASQPRDRQGVRRLPGASRARVAHRDGVAFRTATL